MRSPPKSISIVQPPAYTSNIVCAIVYSVGLNTFHGNIHPAYEAPYIQIKIPTPLFQIGMRAPAPAHVERPLYI